MRNRFFLPAVILLSAVLVVFCVANNNAKNVFAGSLSCTATTSTCSSPSVIVLRLASSTNSHSEIPSLTDYPVIICCSGVPGLGNSCAAGTHAVVLNLASSTNSHVEEGTLGNYTVQACLSVAAGSVSVGYTTSTCASAGFDTTVLTIASSTNSHAAQAGGFPINVCATAVGSTPTPVISNVVLNNALNVVLTPNATTSVSISATITDASGCSDITGGTTTVLLYRSGVSSSTCATTQNNTDCYSASAFTASSTCSSNAVNATTTFGVYYFAQATDASSSFPAQSWIATVNFRDSGGATGTADSSGQDLLTLTAINVTTSSINYGTLNASSTTGSTNRTTTIQNAGNSSTTLKLSGTIFTNGLNTIATSSQHYATSSFTFGAFAGSETPLNGTPIAIAGLILTAPTSTASVQSTIFWGDQVPFGSATGTYSASTIFTGVFSP